MNIGTGGSQSFSVMSLFMIQCAELPEHKQGIYSCVQL